MEIDPPKDLTLDDEGRGDTYLRVAWSAVADATGYRIQVDGASIVATPKLVHQLHNLEPARDYRIEVFTVTRNGESPTSASILLRTRIPRPTTPIILPLTLGPFEIVVAAQSGDDLLPNVTSVVVKRVADTEARVEITRRFVDDESTSPDLDDNARLVRDALKEEFRVVDRTDPAFRSKTYRCRLVAAAGDYDSFESEPTEIVRGPTFVRPSRSSDDVQIPATRHQTAWRRWATWEHQ